MKSASFSYRIIPEHSCIVLRFAGRVSLRTVTENLPQLWADPQYDRQFNGIVDLTAAKAGGSAADVRLLLDFFRGRKMTQGRWAAVFAEPKLTALALVYQRLGIGRPTLSVVSTWEAACDFVRVKLPRDVMEAGGAAPA